VQCTHILDEISATEVTIQDHQAAPTGTLRLNLPVTFGEIVIAPHLWKFLLQYPKLKPDLIMVDHYIDLVKEGVDCAIRVGPLSDSNLIAKKIGSFNRIAVATPEYLAKHGEPNSLNDLKDHDCIVFSLLSTRNDWQFAGPHGPESFQATQCQQSSINARCSTGTSRYRCDTDLANRRAFKKR